MNDNPKCPHCGGETIKQGTRVRAGGNRVQAYQCTTCGKFQLRPLRKEHID